MKFVLILATATICALVLLGGLWYVRVKTDAERHIRVGDEYMQAGDARGAFKAYGRAVSKDQANLGYVDKMEQALLQIKPNNREDANALYGSRIDILRHRLRYQGGDPQRHLDLIDQYVEAARLVLDRRMWDMVGESADTMWSQVGPSVPERIDARLYRGMASLQRVTVLGDEELDAGEADVRAYLEAHPDSDLGWATLILGQMWRLEKARGEGLSGRAGELRQAVRESFESAQQAVPDGPEVARARVMHVVIERVDGAAAESDQQTVEAADRLLERIRGSDDPLLIADTARILQMLAWLGYVPAAIDLLEQYIERHPDALVHRLLLGRSLLTNDHGGSTI
jgi:tetratricopeptide (TPR) repeat protein